MSVRPITDTLRKLQGGIFIDQCSDLLAGIVKAVDETGKAGKLSITIDVKKTGATGSVLAKVTDKTPEKTPEKTPDPDMFWPTVEGNLSEHNPNQRNLDLRVADSGKGKVQTVDPETGEIRQVAAG